MFALPNKTTQIVTKMIRKLIKTYDCPSTMIYDNAAEFTSEAIKTLYAAYAIRKLEVAPYHRTQMVLSRGSIRKSLNSQKNLRRT